MTLAEYLFKIEKVRDEDAAAGGVYDFWSVDGQNTYYFFTCGDGHDLYDLSDLTELLCDFEFYQGEMRFVDWQELQPLFDIRISDDSEFPEHEPSMRNQVIVIRGTCSGQCAERIKPYDGYTTGLVPCCEPIFELTSNGDALLYGSDAELEIENLKADKNVKVGTAVRSQKNASFKSMFYDAVVWVKYCKCVDAVIFNLDSYLNMADSDTAGAYAAIHIKNGQLRIVTGEALKKLYRQYCKYPAIDYELEKSISCLLNQYFKFER